MMLPTYIISLRRRLKFKHFQSDIDQVIYPLSTFVFTLMMQYLHHFYAAIVLLLSIVIAPILLLISLQLIRLQNVPPNLPWVGLQDKRLFRKLRATLREVTVGRAPIVEGYEKYSKHGRPFIIPGMHWSDVALPPSNNAWLAAQPENTLSAIKTQDDFLGFEYLAHGPNGAAVHDFSVIRRDLTREVGRLLPEVLDELSASFEEGFRLERREWKEVKIVEVIQKTVKRTTNRIFVGMPLCRDEEYLKGLGRWEIALALTSIFLRLLVPYRFRPIFGPLVAIPINIRTWQLTKRLLPMIRSRIASRKTMIDMRDDTHPSTRPNDVLEWIIKSSEQRDGTLKLSPHDIAGKTILFNFFGNIPPTSSPFLHTKYSHNTANFTTSITATTVLFDILAYPSAATLISELRSEALAAFPNLPLDPHALASMTRMDSVIRESLRFNPMFGRVMMREVVKSGGVTTPEGLHLPQGMHVCALVASMQRDPTLYERADEFVPLRYYEAEKQRSATEIGEEYLPFGLGRHAW